MVIEDVLLYDNQKMKRKIRRDVQKLTGYCSMLTERLGRVIAVISGWKGKVGRFKT